eukprot:scaffold45_cov368-Prasinococcus_capsulatus_cf.AAC.2
MARTASASGPVATDAGSAAASRTHTSRHNTVTASSSSPQSLEGGRGGPMSTPTRPARRLCRAQGRLRGGYVRRVSANYAARPPGAARKEGREVCQSLREWRCRQLGDELRNPGGRRRRNVHTIPFTLFATRLVV